MPRDVLPTWVGLGTPQSGIGAVVPTLTSGWQPGDLFLLIIQTANQPPSAPAGWSFAFAQGTGTAGTAGATSHRIYFKFAETGDSDPTVPDAGDHQFAVIAAVRGTQGIKIASSPGNVSAVSDTTVTATSASTLLPETLIVYVATAATSTTTPQYSGETNATVTQLTERFDQFVTDGVGGGIGIWTAEKATVGGTGTFTATLATASFDTWQQILIEPDQNWLFSRASGLRSSV